MAGRFTKEEIESLLEGAKLWREDKFKHAQYVYERCRKEQMEVFLRPLKNLSQCLKEFDSLRAQWRSFSSGGKDYLIEGDLDGTPVEVLFDTGAEYHVMSLSRAMSLKLTPLPGTARRLESGNGTILESLGVVTVPWKFRGESRIHSIDFSIIPNLIHDVIFSSKFLRDTRTLVKHFKRRVKEVVRPLRKLLRLRLLGNTKERLRGLLKGKPVAALPDSASDVMLISENYASQQGFNIDNSPENQLELELPDGERAFTEGKVEALDWTFGSSGKAIKCDFYVLKGLPVDVVLSNEFLFHFNTFSRFEEHFFQLESTTDLAELYPIRYIGRYSDKLRQLEEASLNALTSSDAFSLEMMEAENVHRDKIRDIIKNLPESQQENARKAEEERKRNWDNARAEHLARQRSPSSSKTRSPAESSPPPNNKPQRRKLFFHPHKSLR